MLPVEDVCFHEPEMDDEARRSVLRRSGVMDEVRVDVRSIIGLDVVVVVVVGGVADDEVTGLVSLVQCR